MVYGAIAQIARPFIGKVGRQIYQALRAQDRIIDYTYRKTGLYNRGVVRGIQHGLSSGAAIGGTFQLGLNAPDTPGNDNAFPPVQQRSKSKTRTTYKTRRRLPVCRSRRNTIGNNRDSSNRYSNSRRY